MLSAMANGVRRVSLLVWACLGLAAVFRAQDPAPRPSHIERLRASIEKIAAEHAVPGISVAVVEDFALAGAFGVGVCEAGTDRLVDESTLFQAASVSKSVAAAGALVLVEKERLSLDADVNEKLESWQLADADLDTKITLRHVLSHMGGLTVHGFPGYAPGVELPRLADVLDGKKPANTGPVRARFDPGVRWRYSGGGYTIAQQLIVDVTGQPFDGVMRDLVLEPLGMQRSTFAQPLPKSWHGNAAHAHDRRGRAEKHPWHVYPEQAAAGLWTTPSDLARFFLALRAAWIGREGALLSKQRARDMLAPQLGGPWGLGLQLGGKDATEWIAHGGSNWGFRCRARLYLGSGKGVVVMTNCSNGRALAEAVAAAAKVLAFPE